MNRSAPLRRKSRLARVSAKWKRRAAEWKAVVAEARRLARGRCARCGAHKGPWLDPHHLVPRSRGGKNVLDNVRMICRECHNSLHFACPPDRDRWIRRGA